MSEIEYTLHINRIRCNWDPGVYGVWFDQAEYRLIYDPDPIVRKKVKRAFAALRKAIKVYRQSPDYAHLYGSGDDLATSVTGDLWTLPRPILLHVADWLSFPFDLEQQMKQADADAEAFLQRIRAEDERANAFWTYVQYSAITQVNDALNVLQLSHSATQDDVKRQYRILAKQHHPDVGGDAEQFKRINTAYHVLQQWRPYA